MKCVQGHSSRVHVQGAFFTYFMCMFMGAKSMVRRSMHENMVPSQRCDSMPRLAGGAIIAGVAILYSGFCRDETPARGPPRSVREFFFVRVQRSQTLARSEQNVFYLV